MELQEIGHGIKTVDDLVEIALKANPLVALPSDRDEMSKEVATLYSIFFAGDVMIPSIKGWKVVFFYDAMELDYISAFVTPDGEQINLYLEPKLKDEIADKINEKWESIVFDN